MILIPLLLLASCASAYKLPCEFNVQVRITADPDGECRMSGAVDHLGQKPAWNQNIRGCSLEGGIISNGSTDNLGHEVKHQADRHCL